MGKVLSINISSVKGVVKDQVDKVNVIENWGLEGDAHAGNWNRQVSILPVEVLDQVPLNKKEEVLLGGYTENFTISGVPLQELEVDAVIRIGKAEVKIYQIGKEHKEHGRPYIVSRQARFGKVVKGGKVSIGDEVLVL